MWLTMRSLMFVIGKGIGAMGLGCVILWQVVVHIGPQHGVAYIHVPTPNVDVMVDDVKHHVDTLWETPIVCELSPGIHRLRMLRSGTVVFQEEFRLAVGEEIVLTAWEKPSETQKDAAPWNRLESQARYSSQRARRFP